MAPKVKEGACFQDAFAGLDVAAVGVMQIMVALWESIRRHAGNVRVEELYFGFVYLAVGEKNAAGARL